jgi:hypothetical protein
MLSFCIRKKMPFKRLMGITLSLTATVMVALLLISTIVSYGTVSREAIMAPYEETADALFGQQQTDGGTVPEGDAETFVTI